MNTTTASLQAGFDPTAEAAGNALLKPRFYRTDYAAIDRLDVTPLQAEWEALMQEFRGDSNRNHFERDAAFESEIRRNIHHPQIRELMQFMARDESRHAGFINKSLKDYGIAVDLGALTRRKKYTFFKPKSIYYATYLSEKIGYARYICIYRQLERHPELRFHPIFRWFERWCNDEFRHGEAFALILRLQPHLLRGGNRLWIRFFLLAVFATMYVRDHARPELHKAFGLDPTTYDMQVLHITSEISRQVFPFTLDLEHPAMRAGLDRLSRWAQAAEAARKRGGLFGWLRLAGCAGVLAYTFVRLYFLPTREHGLPEQIRVQPAW